MWMFPKWKIPRGGKMMKVYCIAYIDGRYMFPASNTKIYKRFGDAQKACDKLNASKQGGLEAIVLVADNWHKEDQK